MPVNPSIPSIPSVIAAVGALGTASYGLVDASKALWGGLSNAGFTFISQSVSGLLPGNDSAKGGQALLSTSAVLGELKASWLNGAPLTDQRTIAKSLIKLRMNAENAKALAEKAGVDGIVLTSVATKMATGEALTPVETDVSGRFDLILTAALNEAYQRADQRYRNWCKLAAIPVSIVLAVVGGWTIYCSDPAALHNFIAYFKDTRFVEALIAGLLATPLAPVAKDLSTAVQAGAKVAQAIKK
jgi:hypothetical protein